MHNAVFPRGSSRLINDRLRDGQQTSPVNGFIGRPAARTGAVRMRVTWCDDVTRATSVCAARARALYAPGHGAAYTYFVRIPGQGERFRSTLNEYHAIKEELDVTARHSNLYIILNALPI